MLLFCILSFITCFTCVVFAFVLKYESLILNLTKYVKVHCFVLVSMVWVIKIKAFFVCNLKK